MDREILSVDIQISPKESQKLVIREKDDPEEIATLFCNKHNLDMSIRNNLLDQLNSHIDNYYKNRGE